MEYYGITMIAGFTLLAILVAVFVFAVSIFRAVSELSVDEEEKAIKERIDFIERERPELAERIASVTNDNLQKELRKEQTKLDGELAQMDAEISKLRKKVNTLTLRHMVSIPGAVLVLSIVMSVISIVVPERIGTITWIISLVLIVVAILLTYQNLRNIEYFSKRVDLSTLVERAIERYGERMRPIITIITSPSDLIVERGKTSDINYILSVKRGLTAKKIRVRFCATEELEFPGEDVKDLPVAKDRLQMKNPKTFECREDSLTRGSHAYCTIKLKAPDSVGEYAMSYWVTCDDFVGEEQPFIIRVVETTTE